MPNWKKESKCFEETLVDVTTWDTKRNREVRGRGHWPHVKSVAQIVYEEFMSKITNPTTGEFYSQRDRDGNQIKQKDGKNARYVIKTIVRLRRKDGSEKLYSMGQLQGFTSLGVPITRPCREPEVWTRTIFNYDRKFDPKTQTVVEVCKGPSGNETVYELPFNSENLDKLYSQADPQEVSFVVKDERTGMAVNVGWSSPEETYKLFKTKDFKYLFNADYIPEPVKAEIRAKAEALNPGSSNQIPNIQSDPRDTHNYKGYTL